jgi:hypothetical protein
VCSTCKEDDCCEPRRCGEDFSGACPDDLLHKPVQTVCVSCNQKECCALPEAPVGTATNEGGGHVEIAVRGAALAPDSLSECAMQLERVFAGQMQMLLLQPVSQINTQASATPAGMTPSSKFNALSAVEVAAVTVSFASDLTQLQQHLMGAAYCKGFTQLAGLALEAARCTVTRGGGRRLLQIQFTIVAEVSSFVTPKPTRGPTPATKSPTKNLPPTKHPVVSVFVPVTHSAARFLAESCLCPRAPAFSLVRPLASSTELLECDCTTVDTSVEFSTAHHEAGRTADFPTAEDRAEDSGPHERRFSVHKPRREPDGALSP